MNDQTNKHRVTRQDEYCSWGQHNQQGTKDLKKCDRGTGEARGALVQKKFYKREEGMNDAVLSHKELSVSCTFAHCS